MAGDWIAMQTSLWDCPEVVRILSAFCPQNVRNERDSMSAPCPHHVHTGAERNEMKCKIIGALFRTWTLFDMYSDDGELFGYDANTLNDYVGMDHWAENLQHVGWLALSPQSITMTRFEKWMSKSAKRRLQDADRKRRERSEPPKSTSAFCPQSVRKMSATSVTREEKRREENKINTPDVSDDDIPWDFPPDDAPKPKPKRTTKPKLDEEAFAAFWKAYPRREARSPAAKAFVKASARFDMQAIISQAVAFATAKADTDLKFLPLPATWLNEERYLDDPTAWKNGKPKRKIARPLTKEELAAWRPSDAYAPLDED